MQETTTEAHPPHDTPPTCFNYHHMIPPSSRTISLSESLGFNSITYLGEFQGDKVFSLDRVDSLGFPLPTGLPYLCIEAGEDSEIITGERAFELLSSFSEE